MPGSNLIPFLVRLPCKYLLWHVRQFWIVYDRVMLTTNGKMFCGLFNFKVVIKRLDVRFSYDPAMQVYFAKSGTRTIRFQHRRQANMAYGAGIRARATTLGAAYLLHRIEFLPGDRVIDCGANVGDLLLYFRERGIAVSYIGIEASPLEYRCMAMNVSPHETHNVGLWFEDGMLDFYVSSQGADSSLIEPPAYDEVVKVPTRRLDGLIDGNIKLLKMDAEGGEPEVLMGSEKILDRIEYISADLGYERGVQQQTTLPAATNFLLARNFELIDISYGRHVALFRNKAYSRPEM